MITKVTLFDTKPYSRQPFDPAYGAFNCNKGFVREVSQ